MVLVTAEKTTTGLTAQRIRGETMTHNITHIRKTRGMRDHKIEHTQRVAITGKKDKTKEIDLGQIVEIRWTKSVKEGVGQHQTKRKIGARGNQKQAQEAKEVEEEAPRGEALCQGQRKKEAIKEVVEASMRLRNQMMRQARNKRNPIGKGQNR